ncbi:MAG TPA: RluA family pseudouridine synthase [Paludibacteraceae bacterium]|nr:RluA family pseudouridine synthase [Paludibacteraceae bacterium]HOL29758.1 RluA family pseudouridine synthase [Paludibacteraceae bacterium]
MNKQTHKRTPLPSTKKGQEMKVSENALLLDFLLKSMNHKSRNSVKSLLKHGQIVVNGKTITRYDYPLKLGDIITVGNHQSIVEKNIPQMRILYEDDDIIVIDKEAGLLTITTGNGIDITAVSLLKDYVQKQSPYNKIYTVHRLDQMTSGVLVFAKNSEAQHQLRDNWHNMVTKRTYVAVVEGKMDESAGKISSWLTENKKNYMVYSSPVDNGGKLAITRYKVLQTSDQFSLLELELETGRKNQIRVHLKYLGHPIVGDRKYGASTSIGRIALHARVLEFYHPVSGEIMHFETPVPHLFLRLL